VTPVNHDWIDKLGLRPSGCVGADLIGGAKTHGFAGAVVSWVRGTEDVSDAVTLDSARLPVSVGRCMNPRHDSTKLSHTYKAILASERFQNTRHVDASTRITKINYPPGAQWWTVRGVDEAGGDK